MNDFVLKMMECFPIQGSLKISGPPGLKMSLAVLKVS